MHLASSKSLRLRLRRAVLLTAGTCLLLLVAVPATMQTSQNRYLVMLGGTLIDGTGADPVHDAAVVIRGHHMTFFVSSPLARDRAFADHGLRVGRRDHDE